jgi:hypothetical protein
MHGKGCALYIRCALSIHPKEYRKVWGARYTSVRVIYRKILLLLLLLLSSSSSLALQPSAVCGLLVHNFFVIIHKGAPQSVELLWTSDQLVAETST